MGVSRYFALGISIALLQCSSSSSSGGGLDGGGATGSGGAGVSGCKAKESLNGKPIPESGCVCGEWAADSSEPAFGIKCAAANVGSPSLCCNSLGDTSCSCDRIRCGPSKIDGDCVCGAQLAIEHEVPSCTGSATYCCKTDTGYCYCRNTPCGFGSYDIPTCEVSDADIRCDYDKPVKDSCE